MTFQNSGRLVAAMLLSCLLVMTSCSSESELAESVAAENPIPASSPLIMQAPPVFGYRVIQSYPHDPNAFTQGLVYDAGELYEGTGIRGNQASGCMVEWSLKLAMCASNRTCRHNTLAKALPWLVTRLFSSPGSLTLALCTTR